MKTQTIGNIEKEKEQMIEKFNGRIMADLLIGFDTIKK